MALVVKNPPANAGDVKPWIRSLGQEDPLEVGVAARSNILAWRISGQRSLVGNSSQGHKESDTVKVT